MSECLTWLSSLFFAYNVLVCIGANINEVSYISDSVVIWSDVLGGVLIREDSLPWSGPLLSHEVPGERRETGQTSQCCLLSGNVSQNVRLRLS